jgi:hypothetical protein
MMSIFGPELCPMVFGCALFPASGGGLGGERRSTRCPASSIAAGVPCAVVQRLDRPNPAPTCRLGRNMGRRRLPASLQPAVVLATFATRAARRSPACSVLDDAMSRPTTAAA